MNDVIEMNKIAIDIDEVLVSFVKPMAKWRGYQMPTSTKYKYIYRDMFAISEEESRKMVLDFYNSETFAELEPICGSVEGTRTLRGVGKKLYAVTGRQDVARDVTETWLNKHFPDIFDDVVFTNSFTPDEIPKSAICTTLDVDTIIDDSIDTCRECLKNGISAYNFIGYDDEIYPWCHYGPLSVKKWY